MDPMGKVQTSREIRGSEKGRRCFAELLAGSTVWSWERVEIFGGVSTRMVGPKLHL